MHAQEQIIINTANRLLASTPAAAIHLPLADGKSLYMGSPADIASMLPDQSGAAVRGEAVAVQTGWKLVPVEATWEMTRPAFSFDVWRVRCDCGQEHSGGLSHNKAAQLFKSMADAAPASARAADAPSEPSEFIYQFRARVLPGRVSLEWSGWEYCQKDAYDEMSSMPNFQVRVFGLIKSRAADALDSQPTEPVADVQARVRDAVADNLRGLYYCGRVWSAWARGTMSEGDFSRAEDDDDIIANIKDAVMEAIGPASSQPTDGGVRNG